MTGPIRNKPLYMGTRPIRGLADGVAADDAATKGQIDSAISAEETARDTAIAAALQIADDRILSNISGATAGASANTLTAILDAIVSADRGSLLVRGETAWAALAPGTAGRFLQSQGAGADLTYGEVTQTWTTVFKTADQARTSSTAWVDVTDLNFSVVSGARYQFRFSILATTGTGGMDISLNGPASTWLMSDPVATTTNDTVLIVTGGGLTTGRVHFLFGFIQPSADGTLTLRMRQTASSAQASTIRAGSTLEWARMP
jgi:hypothetical protein